MNRRRIILFKSPKCVGKVQRWYYIGAVIGLFFPKYIKSMDWNFFQVGQYVGIKYYYHLSLNFLGNIRSRQIHNKTIIYNQIIFVLECISFEVTFHWIHKKCGWEFFCKRVNFCVMCEIYISVLSGNSYQ